MPKLRIVLGGKIYKRSAQSMILREERETWVDPLVSDETEIVTYYVTWVIIDMMRVDIQRLDGFRFWELYTGDCDGEV